MTNLIFLKPIFHEKIWGGQKMKEYFGYPIPTDKTGEAWCISGHKNGDCLVEKGFYQGMLLSDLWKENRELFGNISGDQFPLLVKILDASNDLSVQVHPNDEYARANSNDLGKTECWYVLDAENDAQIIYGHNASSKEEFLMNIEIGNWTGLLRTVNVKKGDFIYVPTGIVHALKKGILVLEIQQSSDTTYRLYDYDRKDSNGQLRQLHIKESSEVSLIPHVDPYTEVKVNNLVDTKITQYISNEFFTIFKLDVQSKYCFKNQSPFILVSVLTGEAIFNNEKITKGMHFIVPNNIKYIEIYGEVSLILATL